MAKILITGGAGFIGSNLALALLKRGYQVRVLDNLSPQIHGSDPAHDSPLYASIKDKVDFIRGSVTERSDWEKALEGVDTVVHLAAETGTGQSMYEIERYVSVNIGGTALLLDILANKPTKVKRVVVAESRAIYGEGRYYDAEADEYVYPLTRTATDMEAGDFEVKRADSSVKLQLVSTTEDSLVHPTSVYGITKQVQGQLVHMVCQSIGKESVSLRYQNVYGPGQSLSNPYTGILSIFSTRILGGKDINIFEDGKETRDFVYIDDVVEATIRAIETPEANGLAFNIGTGIATDVLTVARTLIEKYGSDVKLQITGNFRLGDIRHNYADITLAREVLGFKPQWDFDRGIAEFAKWVKTQTIKEDKYEASLKEMREKGLFK